MYPLGYYLSWLIRKLNVKYGKGNKIPKFIILSVQLYEGKP